MFAGGHFAQLLEGPPDAINQLMISIQKDVRHTNLIIVREGENVARVFESWYMAYNGSSVLVARHVRALSTPFAARTDAQVDRFIDMMTSLVGNQGPASG
jgi:hypothetical protein